MATQELREKLYEDFLKEFPLESLKDMTLEKYTNLNREDSFCYWIESKTYELGSIWGGSSYKFGIYRYDKKPDNPTIVVSDDQYAWYKRYNAENREEAYHIVLASIIRIAECAAKGEFDKIDDDCTFGKVFRWKIAFLYSNKKLVPIYKKEMLRDVAEKLDMENVSKASIWEMQQFLMRQKGDRDLFEYYDYLLTLLPHVVYNTWDDAIIRVLGDSNTGLKASDISDRILANQYYKTKGKKHKLTKATEVAGKEVTINGAKAEKAPAKKAAVHYSITLPSDANGKFTITFNAYRNGNFTAFKSKEITFPYDQNFDETITGEGAEKVYVMLENDITWDSGITIGNYVFDYDNGNITIEYEDVRKAFEDAGAFRDYTQSDFKRQSVNEFMSMLNGIRGIQDDKTWLLIAEQSVSLLNWSMGTTLTNDEIVSAWGIYTDNWTEADFDSFRRLYQLVYDEAFNIVTNGDGELLAQLGYSESDFSFVELPLEPMETIKALT